MIDRKDWKDERLFHYRWEDKPPSERGNLYYSIYYSTAKVDDLLIVALCIKQYNLLGDCTTADESCTIYKNGKVIRRTDLVSFKGKYKAPSGRTVEMAKDWGIRMLKKINKTNP